MMKKLKSSMAAKVIAVILFCLMSLTLVLSVTGISVLADWGAYSTDRYEDIQVNAVHNLSYSRVYSAWDMYSNGIAPDEIYPDSNFRFAIYDGNGEEIYSNRDGEKAMLRTVVTMEPRYHIESSEGYAGGGKTIYTVYVHSTGEYIELEAGAEFEK